MRQGKELHTVTGPWRLLLWCDKHCGLDSGLTSLKKHGWFALHTVVTRQWIEAFQAKLVQMPYFIESNMGVHCRLTINANNAN